MGQHRLFLAEVMQRGSLGNRLCRPFKENSPFHRFASSFAEFIAQATVQIMAVAGGCLHWLSGNAHLPGRGGSSLNFNHILAASAMAGKILVYVITNKMCYIYMVSSATST